MNPYTGAQIQHDASGNLISDGGQTYQYDATGQMTHSPASGLVMGYDGDRLRVKKAVGTSTTYYVRSSVLGGQVVAELNQSGAWTKGYVYLGGQVVATGQNGGGVLWVHQDPVTKSQRLTDTNGGVTSTLDLDPWGGETSKSYNPNNYSHKFTSYERDADGGDEAQQRRYTGAWGRFSQPDPYDGSASLADPQFLNRYAYVQNDPINFTDPSGLLMQAPQAGESCGQGKKWVDYSDVGGGWECEEVPQVDVWTDPFTLTGGAALLYMWDPLRGVRGGASTDEGGGGGGNNPIIGMAPRIPKSNMGCPDLLNRITELRNELAKRHDELLRNDGNLPLTGPMSIGGHQQQFGNKQIEMRDALEQFNTKGCGGGLPSDVWSWATAPVPSPAPGPGASPRVITPGRVGAAIGTGVVIYGTYRVIRMLPSLAPPLWWTIPANAAIP